MRYMLISIGLSKRVDFKSGGLVVNDRGEIQVLAPRLGDRHQFRYIEG